MIVLSTSGSSDDAGTGGEGRPPAAAPQGTKIVDGDGFGIAVPSAWIVGTDPGSTFGQLQQRQWGEPRVASDTDGGEALVVAPLRNVAHDPLADPELFWSDQVVGEGSARTVSDSASLGVHGLKANRVMIHDRSGSVLAVAIETRRGVYLVAFRAPDRRATTARFQQLIKTFDVR